MNAIQHAINRATREIPRPILENTFIDRSYMQRASPKSLEQRIKEEVILKFVLQDLNVTNGVYSYIPLAYAKQVYSDQNTFTYYIPKELTGGRAITTVISINYQPYRLNNASYGYQTQCQNTMLNRATDYLLNSISDPQVAESTRVDLVGENTILVHDSPMTPAVGTLVCILENDDELSTIRPRLIPEFTKLIILAIKAYIYNEQVLLVDKAQLYSGHELGKYREIIESYSDCMEQYQTMLDEKIGKLFYMNSKENMTRHVRFMLGGRR